MKNQNEEFRLSGKTLKVIRILFDLSQSEMAVLLGVKKQQISYAESSKRKLTREQTLKFLEIVQLSETVTIDFDKIIKQVTDVVTFDEMVKRLEY